VTSTTALDARPAVSSRLGEIRPSALLAEALAFAVLFAKPAALLARDWWTNPEAGHGLLLAPVGIWLAWRIGFKPQPTQASYAFGLGTLLLAVLVRGTSELAAEPFTMRMSMVLALAGLVILHAGIRQALRWWLPFVLLGLSVPLPELITSAMALPLQYKASQMGAALLEWRHVPVRLSGNVLDIPNHRLFVTEACSGLRSLTALLSLAVLMGGLWLTRLPMRVLLFLIAVPIAILINGVRVFLTGFLVYYVDPKLGQGFMHLTEGWLLFLVSLLLIGVTVMLFRVLERALWRGSGGKKGEPQHAAS